MNVTEAVAQAVDNLQLAVLRKDHLDPQSIPLRPASRPSVDSNNCTRLDEPAQRAQSFSPEGGVITVSESTT